MQLWDAVSGSHQKLLEGHSGRVNCVVFSLDGKYLLTGSNDQTIKLWDAHTGGLLKTLQGHHYVTSIAISPSGDYVVAGLFNRTARLYRPWEERPAVHERQFNGHDDEVTTVSISPDATIIASGSVDMSVWLWNAAMGDTFNQAGRKNNEQLKGHSAPMNSIAFSNSGAFIVAGDEKETIHTCDNWIFIEEI